jgi:hypothetical protein
MEKMADEGAGYVGYLTQRMDGMVFVVQSTMLTLDILESSHPPERPTAVRFDNH